MISVAEPVNPPKWRRLVVFIAGFLGIWAGLCTLIALLVTAAQAWQEYTQARWPEASATVQRCGLDIYTYRSGAYWINCNIRYEVHGEEILSRVHSLTIRSPRRLIVQYPPGQFDRMQEWVDAHPEGTPIRVRYDPANHGKAVLVDTDMPRGGPQTPSNLKLLEFFAATCAVLVTIARMARPRPGAGMT